MFCWGMFCGWHAAESPGDQGNWDSLDCQLWSGEARHWKRGHWTRGTAALIVVWDGQSRPLRMHAASRTQSPFSVPLVWYDARRIQPPSHALKLNPESRRMPCTPSAACCLLPVAVWAGVLGCWGLGRTTSGGPLSVSRCRQPLQPH